MAADSWKIPYCEPDIPSALTQAGYAPLLAAVLALRGARTPEAAAALLEGDAACVPSGALMLGMGAAAERLRLAIERGEKTAVYGDYDVDGITSTCLVADYLRYKGLECILYIPDRSGEGYGLNRAALDSLKDRGVTLVITVDCGITAIEEADYARALGLDMVITDHHECSGGKTPEACAVIDPKQPGDLYPNKYLAGVGVALKLVCAAEGERESMLERYCDLAAIGTIADVMPLVGENRYLVRRGLELINRAPRPGIAAMLREAGADGKTLTATTVSFTLAPRLNAAGRLDHADIAARLLLCEDKIEAEKLARELCELNRKRQSIENGIWEQAALRLGADMPDGPIVLADEGWHQGVIGIAASRLAEQYSLPTVMICLNGDVGKGSCRSFGGFNLYEALCACARHLMSFGGHALAAGLNIEKSRVGDFTEALREYYLNNRPVEQPEVCCELLIANGALLDIEGVRALDRLEPFGSENARPVLGMIGAVAQSLTAVGGGKHLKMRVRLGGSRFDCIFFSHNADSLGIAEGDSIDLAFTAQINEYRSRSSVQLMVTAVRRHEPLSLCEAILAQERCEYAASVYTPERCDFVRLWRGLGEGFTVGENAQAVLAQCPGDMEPERFCLCLAALYEAGLLSGGSGIYGSSMSSIAGKADLEDTGVMKRLRAYG